MGPRLVGWVRLCPAGGGCMSGGVMEIGKFTSPGFKTPGFRGRGLMQLESEAYKTEATMAAPGVLKL